MKFSYLIPAAIILGISAMATPRVDAATPLVIGYAYEGVIPSDTVLSKLTHIDIAFVNPNAIDGTIFISSSDKKLIQKAHAKNVKVFISLGGEQSAYHKNDAHPHGLLDLYAKWLHATNRSNFIKNITDSLQSNNIDGVDVDIEGPGILGVGSSTVAKINAKGETTYEIVSNYELFIQELSAALKPLNKGVSAALSVGYGAKDVTDNALKYLDLVNMMSYDEHGNWPSSGPGSEASMDQAEFNINYFSLPKPPPPYKDKKTNKMVYPKADGKTYGREIPKSHLVLGVPFYGAEWNRNSLTSSWSFVDNFNYRDIVAAHAKAEIDDFWYKLDPKTDKGKIPVDIKDEKDLKIVLDHSLDVIFYNGTSTIQKKAKKVKGESLAGMMIWQISGDTTDDTTSLLKIMYDTLYSTNVAPIISAGLDQTITLSPAASVTVSLAGRVIDADNDVTAKQWTKVIGPGVVNFITTDQANTLATFTMTGTYVLNLRANDAHGHIVNDEVIITIKPYSPPTANVAPVVSAGLDKTVVLTSSGAVTINLSGSVFDADGDDTLKLWKFVSGPGAVSFGTSGLVNTSATFTVAGTYALSFSADDRHNHYITDSMQVVVSAYNSGGTGETIVYEAEAAVVSGAVKTASYVDFIHASNDYIEWTVNAPSAGTYLLTFKYALSSGNRPLAISINGNAVTTQLGFPSTGSTSIYKTVVLQMTLVSGANTVRATAIGASGANMDALIVSPASGIPTTNG